MECTTRTHADRICNVTDNVGGAMTKFDYNASIYVRVIIEQNDERRGDISFMIKPGETTLGEINGMLINLKRKIEERLDEIFTHYRIWKDAQS